MAGADLGVSVVAIADLCSRQGSALLKQCGNLRASDARIEEIVSRIQSYWLRTRAQLGFLQRVWESLEEEHQNILVQILHILIQKLDATNANIARIMPREQRGGAHAQTEAKVKGLASLRLREAMEKALEDLEAWKKTFEPPWYLIMKVADAAIDAQLTATPQQPRDAEQVASAQETLDPARRLRKALHDNNHSYTPPKSSVFQPYEVLNSARTIKIPFTSAKLTQCKESESWLILDSIPIPAGADTPQVMKNVQDLAGRLSFADPDTFGLLNCCGAVKVPHPLYPQQLNSFYMVFRMPRGMSEPSSLRDSLVKSASTDHSLSDRFRIARELARSVYYIHAHGFVHNNIRPETIILLRNEPLTVDSAFLIGFEDSRLPGGYTLQAGAGHWEKNLYRHPRRVKPTPDNDALMQHDIYSLGVCLLELGLWQSFVAYNEDGTGPSPAPILKKMAKNPDGSQLSIKDYLVSLARNGLPTRMGGKYARVVETCLTCLDEDNGDFGDECEFQDEDGVLIGVRAIEKIILQLDSISV